MVIPRAQKLARNIQAYIYRNYSSEIPKICSIFPYIILSLYILGGRVNGSYSSSYSKLDDFFLQTRLFSTSQWCLRCLHRQRQISPSYYSWLQVSKYLAAFNPSLFTSKLIRLHPPSGWCRNYIHSQSTTRALINQHLVINCVCKLQTSTVSAMCLSRAPKIRSVPNKTRDTRTFRWRLREFC